MRVTQAGMTESKGLGEWGDKRGEEGGGTVEGKWRESPDKKPPGVESIY